MRRIGTFLVVLGLLLGSTTALQAGKGGGNGKPGGGGGDPPPDPAIVFPRGDDLVVMNADGSNQTTILRGQVVVNPNWSPDGTQIAFASQVAGDGIYVIDRDGSNLRKVIDVYAPGPAVPSWSPAPAPDGRYKIAYVDSLQSSGKADEVFLVNPDGTGRQQLTPTDPDVFYEQITWSPGADRLAVQVRPEGGPIDVYEEDILVFDLGLSGGEVAIESTTSLTSDADVPGGPLNGARFFIHPSWAKVEDRIAVAVGFTSPAETDIWFIDVNDPSRPVQVTDTPDSFDELGPSWSPDDSRIVFYEFFWTGKIYVMDADGSNLKALASEKGFQNGRVGRPDWRRSP